MITTRPVFDPCGHLSHFIDARDASPPLLASRESPAGSGEGSFPLPSCDAAGRCFNLDACFEMVDVVELGEGRA